MRQIVVRVVETERDGVVFKWRDRAGRQCQRNYTGRNTRNRIDDAKRELEDSLNLRGVALQWSSFKQRFEKSYLPMLAPRAREKPRTMVKRFDEMLKRRGLANLACSDITGEMLLEIREQMMEAGLARATIRSNMNTLWAIVHWGIDAELLPEIRRPRERKQKGDRISARGRSLTMEEIERMIQAIEDNPEFVNGKGETVRVRAAEENSDRIIRAIHGMRLIGLRLEDAHLFRWDPRPGYHYPINLDGRMPRIAISPEQKSGDAEEIPLTPAAAQWLRSLEHDSEYVCRAIGAKGEHRTANRMGRVIANAGRACRIMTKPTGGRGGGPKYASAHDLRRTFVNSVLPGLTLSEAQVLSRHKDKQTLLTYYADSKIEALAEKLSR